MSTDACTCIHSHGVGEDGMAACAILEVWFLEDGRVTFGGFPRGQPGWAAAVWLTIAAEALRQAGEAASSQVSAG